ncbi:Ankyrin repeat family [Trichomonas vaginalis G3]|uniref:Ankyrin repeat family n=1 Tax=Trichomonas vaginalis (strain ATCC PRA-98 / G3) TaxID=412133 RepID=UPI0021E5994F|nr:Ankyrin repeat family [Trichomonas vaginalis G3]KAI5510436.1 Ankyrin repeat family [Trichomonas vaginalis G3]
MIESFISHGADINAKDEEGNSPLYYAFEEEFLLSSVIHLFFLSSVIFIYEILDLNKI